MSDQTLPLLDEFAISDRELIRRALVYAKPSVGQYRWTRVMQVFGLGSTAARALCLAFGLNPDELPPKRKRAGEYTPVASFRLTIPATMLNKGKSP